jgi:hypothetical protein
MRAYSPDSSHILTPHKLTAAIATTSINRRTVNRRRGSRIDKHSNLVIVAPVDAKFKRQLVGRR